jgi:tetratricopeptide (TPR) repeat protein
VIARDAFVHHFGGQTFRDLGIDYNALIRHNQEVFRAKWQNLGQFPRPTSAGHKPEARAKGEAVSPTSAGHKPEAPAKGEPSPSLALQACVQRDRLASNAIAVPPPPAAPAPFTLAPALTRLAAQLIPGRGLKLVRQRVKLSLCMIVRNNESTIRAALESIRPWVDEMIVVDTGSTDRTPEIARELGAKVFFFRWCDSFSAARNFSIDQAQGEWIFWIDSDDTIDAANGRQLRALVEQEVPTQVLAFSMRVHCPCQDSDGQDDFIAVDHVKLFRNRRELRFEHRIHEQILPAINRLGGDVVTTDLFVVHSGYDRSPEGQQRKIERDLKLLHLQFAEQPTHTFTLFNLGMTYTDIRQYAEAIPYLQRSLAYAGPHDSHVRKAYAFLVTCYSGLGQTAEALAVCRQGLERLPEDAELRFQKGQLLSTQGQWAECARTYEDLLAHHDARYFQSLHAGITGYLARFNLAIAYLNLGDPARAEAQCRQITLEKPTFRQGWYCLGQALLRQGKHEEVQAIAAALDRRPGLAATANLLRGEVYLARSQWPEARREFEAGLARSPQHLDLLNALSSLLFDHGPPGEAEAILRRLIEAAPEDASAYHNLATLLSRMGRLAEAAIALEKAVALRPQDVALRLELGQAFATVGRIPEAARELQSVLAIDPGNAIALTGLAKLGR